MGIEGFAEARVSVGEVALSVHRGGSGPALVLLHGFPETHMCWAGIAPRLAEHFDVIVPDLRGYGASDAPPDDPGHTDLFQTADGRRHRRASRRARDRRGACARP
jgi:haloacetate dehalogenase